MTGRNLGIFAAPIAAGWLIGWQGGTALAWTFAAVTLAAAAAGAAMAAAVAGARAARRSGIEAVAARFGHQQARRGGVFLDLPAQGGRCGFPSVWVSTAAL